VAEIIVVHGYPGSGKSYLCERAAEEGIGEAGVQHVSIGDRLRGIREGVVESRFSDEILADPFQHPSDEVATGLVFEPIEGAGNEDIFLVDGFPSYAGSYKMFCEKIQADKHNLIGVIDLNITALKSLERVTRRGRRDGEKIPEDELEGHTWLKYKRDEGTSKIAVMRFRAQGIPWAEIDASGPKDDVYSEFSRALGGFVLKRQQHGNWSF
jgi:adenylate kinase family enzyme